MRKITQEACEAFQSHAAFSKSNTHTTIVSDDYIELYLHNNKIAEKINDTLYVSNAGWPTVTTKERLNGLDGVNISQKAGVWYLNGEKWSGKWARVDTFTGDIDPVDEKKDRDMLKRIKAYSNLYKAPYPLPSGGDPWNFLHGRKDNPFIPTPADERDILIEYMDEKYVFGSMIVEAMREKGYNDTIIAIALNSDTNFHLVQPAIYQFLKKRLTNLAN